MSALTAEVFTYKLRSWNELYEVETKRYFHTPAGRSVEIAPDLRMACRCKSYGQNLKLGLGPCEHAAEAIEFVEAVGYNRLPTWRMK